MSELRSGDQEAAEQGRALIAQLYRAVLRREPDEAGLEFHVSRLLHGTPYRRIVEDFVTGEEFRRLPSRDCLSIPPAITADCLETAFPLNYQPPAESGKSYARRVMNGFYERYCHGPIILDVGFSGYHNPEGLTAVPGAIGVDLDYPGYDGIRLPFEDGSVDTVISSHCLEHILFHHAAIQDWYRVLRNGGHIICFVPHQTLYEKKKFLPSSWNSDHKRMYTVSRLAADFEAVLPTNGFRIRHVFENDTDFDYSIGPNRHSHGSYEIEMVIEKLKQPNWSLA